MKSDACSIGFGCSVTIVTPAAGGASRGRRGAGRRVRGEPPHAAMAADVMSTTRLRRPIWGSMGTVFSRTSMTMKSRY